MNKVLGMRHKLVLGMANKVVAMGSKPVGVLECRMVLELLLFAYLRECELLEVVGCARAAWVGEEVAGCGSSAAFWALRCLDGN